MTTFDLISRLKNAGTSGVISGVPADTVNLLLYQPYWHQQR
ncbi:hypothetical protein [Haliangium sp. UPWRP_2]|nr:hypothetical protein [Haliangium sp. UPWRP_2]